MMIRKPKGLTIFRRRMGGVTSNGEPAYLYSASVKSTGRLNSKVRSLFLRASENKQKMALHDWANGRSTGVLST